MTAHAGEEPGPKRLPKGFFNMEVFSMAPDPGTRERELPDVDVDERAA